MKDVAEPGDGFTAPLPPGSQVPGDREDDPPGAGCHSEVVKQDEDQGAPDALQSTVYAVEAAREECRRLAGDRSTSGEDADDVGKRMEGAAEADEDDGTLGVLEPRQIDEEGENGEGRRRETECRPDRHPRLHESLVFAPKQDVYVTPRCACVTLRLQSARGPLDVEVPTGTEQSGRVLTANVSLRGHGRRGLSHSSHSLQLQ